MKSRVHISLNVSKLEDSIHFYGKLFGEKASKVKPDYANFRLDYPAIHLALVQAESVVQGEKQSPTHFGIELETLDELALWERRAEKESLAILEDKDATCCYAKADKFWISDPDSNRWEVWVNKGEADQLAPQKRSCC